MMFLLVSLLIFCSGCYRYVYIKSPWPEIPKPVMTAPPESPEEDLKTVDPSLKKKVDNFTAWWKKLALKYQEGIINYNAMAKDHNSKLVTDDEGNKVE